MRTTLLSVAAAAALWLPNLPAQAGTIPAAPEVTPPANVVLVDTRCGANRHYVKAHRNKKGVLVKGRCVRDRVAR